MTRKKILVGKLAGRLSRIGERWNSEWLIYNPLLFLHFHWLARKAAPAVIGAIRETIPDVRRVADVGAGSGAYAAEAARQGLEVVACERSWIGRHAATRQGVEAVPFNLERFPPAEFPGRVDAVYCLEVAEHLSPPLGDRLIDFLSNLAPLVIFSAATPGQGGHGHINEQPHSYWIQRFSARQLSLDPARTRQLRDDLARSTSPWWLTNNVMVFTA